MNRAGSIGGGIALIVIGAILVLAVDFSISGFDIKIAGYIAGAAGAVLLIIGLISAFSKKTVHREVHKDPATGSAVENTEL